MTPPIDAMLATDVGRRQQVAEDELRDAACSVVRRGAPCAASGGEGAKAPLTPLNSGVQSPLAPRLRSAPPASPTETPTQHAVPP